jgi:hypothetical protein
MRDYWRTKYGRTGLLLSDERRSMYLMTNTDGWTEISDEQYWALKKRWARREGYLALREVAFQEECARAAKSRKRAA